MSNVMDLYMISGFGFGIPIAAVFIFFGFGFSLIVGWKKNRRRGKAEQTLYFFLLVMIAKL